MSKWLADRRVKINDTFIHQWVINLHFYKIRPYNSWSFYFSIYLDLFSFTILEGFTGWRKGFIHLLLNLFWDFDHLKTFIISSVVCLFSIDFNF